MQDILLSLYRPNTIALPARAVPTGYSRH